MPEKQITNHSSYLARKYSFNFPQSQNDTNANNNNNNDPWLDNLNANSEISLNNKCLEELLSFDSESETAISVNGFMAETNVNESSSFNMKL